MSSNAPHPVGLSQVEQRVRDEVASRASVLLADLRRYVEIPTGLGHTPGLDETRGLLTARCQALGAQTELIPGDPRPAWLDGTSDADGARDGALDGANATIAPPTAVCRRLDAGGAPAVLIAGHLDTVHDPAGPFLKLTIGADAKRATGPGCVDMKGGLVIAIHALEALESVGVRVPWSFLMNSDEETGSFCSDRALRAEASRTRPDGSRVYGVGLALEPAMSKGELAISRGGSGQFRLAGVGRAAHVGRDFASGRSAVEALARGIVAAHALSDVAAGTCVNVGPLRCESPTNVVAERAWAWGNVRYATPERGVELEAKVRALAGPIGGSGADALPRLAVEATFHRPAKALTSDTEALALRARATAEAIGQSLPFGQTAGVCDGNNLQAAGLATIDTLGVRGGGLHTPDEWIDLSSLVERCQLLALTILREGQRDAHRA